MSAWVKRGIENEDDIGMVISHWMSLSAHARASLRAGAGDKFSNGERDFMAEYKPVVRALITTECVDLMVNVEEPSRIWAFLAYSKATAHEPPRRVPGRDEPRPSGDIIHALMVKRDVIEAGFGREIATDLLGDRIHRSCLFTQELHQLNERRGKSFCGVRQPNYWFPDFNFVPMLLARRFAA